MHAVCNLLRAQYLGKPINPRRTRNMLLQFKEYTQISTSKPQKPGKYENQSPGL